MDANGVLIVDGNISINEMTLNADGSYTVGSLLELQVGTGVSYDNATRTLSFTIPDSSKAYQFRYITDVTGTPGMVSNKVSLVGGTDEIEHKNIPYTITAADGYATFQRSGWININKTNNSDVALSGAEFTLYALDGTTIIKKGITEADGTLKFKVIPDGDYIFKETSAPTGYALDNTIHTLSVKTQVVGGVTTVTASIDGRTGIDSHQVTIKNFQIGTVGTLKISKNVVGDGADLTKKFEFTVNFVGASGNYPYIGNGVSNGTIKSGDTISLAHGESITITELPNNATYTVAEKSYTLDGYTITNPNATGTIIADTAHDAVFTNTRTVGSVEISKIVTGNGGDNTKKFDFTITLENVLDKAYPYVGNGIANGTIKSGDTISLAHGESITITDLPPSARYTVVEQNYTDDGYVTTSEYAEGNIVVDEIQKAEFTNTRNIGSLEILKTVRGNAGDYKKKFTFTVSFVGVPDKAYPYTGNGVADGTIKSGDTISLANNESITITELPAGASYIVVEDNYSKDG